LPSRPCTLHPGICPLELLTALLARAMLLVASPNDDVELHCEQIKTGQEGLLKKLLLEAEAGNGVSFSSWDSSSSSSSDESLLRSGSVDTFTAPTKAQVVELQSPLLPVTIASSSDYYNKQKSAYVYAQLCQYLKCYASFCWSSANQELLLKFLQWSLWMLGNTSMLLRVVDHPTPFQDWMTAVSDQLAWARYALRLLGLPSAIEAALTNSWCSDPSSKVYRLLGRFLAWSMVFYYPTEAVAYLQWNRPPSLVEESSYWFAPLQWSGISCCFWCIYVIADLLQCFLQLLELDRRKRSMRQTKKLDAPSSAPAISTSNNTAHHAQQRLLIHVQVQTARNCLQLLPSIQYSLPAFGMPSSFWHPYTINTLMWSESVVGICQALRNHQY